MEKHFEEVYKEKSFFGRTTYMTNFKFINKKGETEFGILRIDKITYQNKLFKDIRFIREVVKNE